MKNSYKKILIFETILFIMLILNSFIDNILNRFSIVIFLLIAVLIFKKLFGTEKNKKRYTKDIIFELLILFLISFIIYYLFGIIVGFYQNENFLTFYGIKEILLPLVLLIIIKEYLRFIILTKCEGNNLLYVSTCILFIALDMTNIFNLSNLSNKIKFFEFIALYFIPSISNNIVACYIAIKSNYKVNWFWILIMELYIYVLPLIPNPGNYIMSIIKTIFPFLVLIKVKKFYDKEKDEYITREYRKKQIIPLIVISLIIIIIVYFTSGIFKHQVIAIASGSMEPYISRGDVVVIEKVPKDSNKLVEGQVIAYKYEGVMVVHRIEKIVETDGIRYYYSKGDANKDIDNYVIYEENIIGVVNIKIPLLGLPTVWLSEI